ncbi:MAG: hypothetical protein D3918_00035 [Candidatus Electrothrix sp. AX2]|nr:hypothetical protein [Candidatus Electrothrix gigas]
MLFSVVFSTRPLQACLALTIFMRKIFLRKFFKISYCFSFFITLDKIHACLRYSLFVMVY